MQEAEAGDAVAEPGKDHLEDAGDREAEREPDPGSPEAGEQRKHQQDQEPEDDDVAEAGVEVPAVLELLVRDELTLVVGVLRDVEGAVPGSADLHEDRDDDQR